MKILIATSIVVVALAQLGNGQNLPDPPKPTDAAVHGSDVVRPILDPEPPTSKVIDNRFVVLQSLAAIATGIDVGLTSRTIGSALCREANPLLGPKPSVGRLVGVTIPIFAGQVALTYYLKKKHPTGFRWMATPVFGTLVHLVGVGSNAGCR